jgi:uncharacterized protein with HEPN domain
MSRDERLYLEDILASCDKVLGAISAANFDQIRRQALVYDGIIFNLLTIGEAVKHLSPATRARYSEIPWPEIAGLRDIIAHGYFGIDEDIIRQVVTHHLAPLRATVQRILA